MLKSAFARGLRWQPAGGISEFETPVFTDFGVGRRKIHGVDHHHSCSRVLATITPNPLVFSLL
jgi:hypothetical protein